MNRALHADFKSTFAFDAKNSLQSFFKRRIKRMTNVDPGGHTPVQRGGSAPRTIRTGAKCLFRSSEKTQFGAVRMVIVVVD